MAQVDEIIYLYSILEEKENQYWTEGFDIKGIIYILIRNIEKY